MRAMCGPAAQESPGAAGCSADRRMFSCDPATTQFPGSFTTARSRPGERCSAMASGLIATAIIAPGGEECISCARIATILIAVSRSKTPARVAATYSPMLCPANTAARTP